MNATPSVDVFCRTPAELGEGPLWHPQRQTFWWVDITGGRLFEARLDGSAPRILPLAGLPSALVPARDGGLIVPRCDGIHHVDATTGEAQRIACPPEHDPLRVRFNDAKCDPAGRLLAGTVALDARPEAARLYRFAEDGSSQVVRDQVSISNGLAWSADGGTFYYIDSPTKLVLAFRYDAESDQLGAPRVAVDLRDRPGLPDGCCIDADDRLWIAHWGESCVTCWDPQHGRHLATIAFPASQITNCTFGGERLDRLFVTSAAIDLPPAKRAIEPLAGCVFCADVGVVGPPATLCKISSGAGHPGRTDHHD